MLAEHPDIAGEGGGLHRRLWNVVGIGQAGSAEAGQRRNLILAEAGQRQIEAERIQFAEFEAKQFIVPAGV